MGRMKAGQYFCAALLSVTKINPFFFFLKGNEKAYSELGRDQLVVKFRRLFF